jgi:hypothetical protein
MPALRGFLLRTLVWLPICFAAWYFLSVLFTPMLAALVGAALGGLFQSVIDGVVADGNALAVLTSIEVGVSPDSPAGEVVFEVNPLKYGYCVPFYTALVLATDADDLMRVLHWLIGMAILLAVQVFGIGTEILKVIAFQLGDQGRSALGFAPWGYEALVLAYQLGYLILPPVVPVMLWLGQFGRRVADTSLFDRTQDAPGPGEPTG